MTRLAIAVAFAMSAMTALLALVGVWYREAHGLDATTRLIGMAALVSLVVAGGAAQIAIRHYARAYPVAPRRGPNGIAIAGGVLLLVGGVLVAGPGPRPVPYTTACVIVLMAGVGLLVLSRLFD
jgi:hypothetical protein